MAKKGGLGMGLGALFDDNSNEAEQSTQIARLSDIEPNRNQPRTDFDESLIANLADSIREHGLLQPILVRPVEGGTFQIVAGERRWRACRMLGMLEVPVVIREFDDMQTAQVALIENLQRENLNPLEEAHGYRDLMDKYGMTQDAVSKIVGKSRSAIANSLRMLKLPHEIQELLRNGDITIGHAKALAGIDDEDYMIELAQRAANGALSVRAIEKISAKDESNNESIGEQNADSYYKEMEISLKNVLGRKVRVIFAKNKGILQLEFYDKEDLAALGDVLASSSPI